MSNLKDYTIKRYLGYYRKECFYGAKAQELLLSIKDDTPLKELQEKYKTYATYKNAIKKDVTTINDKIDKHGTVPFDSVQYKRLVAIFGESFTALEMGLSLYCSSHTNKRKCTHECFARAHALGNIEATFMLSQVTNSENCPHYNPQESHKYHEIAYKAGHLEARLYMARRYTIGHCVPKSLRTPQFILLSLMQDIGTHNNMFARASQELKDLYDDLQKKDAKHIDKACYKAFVRIAKQGSLYGLSLPKSSKVVTITYKGSKIHFLDTSQEIIDIVIETLDQRETIPMTGSICISYKSKHRIVLFRSFKTKEGDDVQYAVGYCFNHERNDALPTHLLCIARDKGADLRIEPRYATKH